MATARLTRTMAKGGEKSEENVVDKDLVVGKKKQHFCCFWIILDSGETTCYKHRCYGHRFFQCLGSMLAEYLLKQKDIGTVLLICTLHGSHINIAVSNNVITHRRFSSYRAGLLGVSEDYIRKKYLVLSALTHCWHLTGQYFRCQCIFFPLTLCSPAFLPN